MNSASHLTPGYTQVRSGHGPLQVEKVRLDLRKEENLVPLCSFIFPSLRPRGVLAHKLHEQLLHLRAMLTNTELSLGDYSGRES